MLVNPRQVVVIDIEDGLFTAVIDQISERSFPRKNLRLTQTLVKSADLTCVIAKAIGYCSGVSENKRRVVRVEFSPAFKEHFAKHQSFIEGSEASEQYFHLFPEDAEEECATSLVH